MPATASKKLWEEALRLGRVVNEVKGEVGKRGVEAIELLYSQDPANVNPQVMAIIKGAVEKNSRYIKGGENLTDKFGDLLRAYRTEIDFYDANWEQLLIRNRRVDAQKIANKQLLDSITQAGETLEGTPEAIQTLVAVAAIAQYSQFLYYADLLNAFLQYPTKFRRTMDAARTLANAAVMDLAGTVFPFAGTVAAAIDTIFDLKEPRINKKIEELEQATNVINRVANLGDQLTDLLDYTDFANDMICLADGTLKTTHSSFAILAAWLNAVLGNAARDDDGIS